MLTPVKPGRVRLDLGAEQCSDAQLLAIRLGSGGRGYSALDSANALPDKYGTLAGLTRSQSCVSLCVAGRRWQSGGASTVVMV